MKVLFIIPDMSSGGTQRKVIMLLRYLNSKKIYPKLVLFKKEGVHLSELPDDVRIIDLKKRSRYSFFILILKLAKIFRSEKPDKIISFIYYSNIISVLAKIISRISSTLIISEESVPFGYLLNTRMGDVKRALIRFTYRKAQKIICVSKGLREYIIKYCGLPESRVIAIYNPIESEKIYKLSIEEVKHPFFDKKIDGELLIISTGRLSIAKRYDILLKVIENVRERKKVNLIIIGDGELKKDLIIQRNNLKLNDCVEFIGYQQNPYAWMSKSDLFVMTSQYEGFSYVIVEAMACGVPVISSDCPFGPIEIIRNNINGNLVPFGDIEKISNNVIDMFNDERRRHRMILAGKIRSLDFDINKIGKEYELIIFNRTAVNLRT